MHKYYKEHYLYNYDVEDIDSVNYNPVYTRINFQVANGYTYIECYDSETTQLVYSQVCRRLLGSGIFCEISNYIINLENIKNMQLRNSYITNKIDTIEIHYFNGNSEAISFKDKEQAEQMYKKLNYYKKYYNKKANYKSL